MTTALNKRIVGWLRDALVFGLALYAMLWWQSRDALSADDNVIIPTMNLPLLSGGVGEIAPAEGRNTLVYFFAPWCGVCKRSIGNLEAVDPETTRVVIIALDYASTGHVQRFVDQTQLAWPVHLGNDDIMMLFHVRAFPSYFILDENFRIIDSSVGYSTTLGLKMRT